jgi:hypothetical protein
MVRSILPRDRQNSCLPMLDGYATLRGVFGTTPNVPKGSITSFMPP